MRKRNGDKPNITVHMKHVHEQQQQQQQHSEEEK